MIISEVEDKNPHGQFGKTPLHVAAENGNLAIFKMIMDVIKDKNPMDQDKLTPLHLAAENGHEQICRQIMNAVLDKNPTVCNKGIAKGIANFDNHKFSG